MVGRTNSESKLSVTVTGGVAQLNAAFDGATINVTQNVADTQQLVALLEAVRKTIPMDSSSENANTVSANLRTIEVELSKPQPRSNLVATALAALKTLKGTVEFTAAVAALVQFIQAL